MYNVNKPNKTTIKINDGYIGEWIEEKIERIVNNNEPISDGAPLIYTERAKGVEPEYDIRTDRFEIAIDAMDKVTKSHKAKRENKAKSEAEQARDNMEKEKKTEKKVEGTSDNTSDK